MMTKKSPPKISEIFVIRDHDPGDEHHTPGVLIPINATPLYDNDGVICGFVSRTQAESTRLPTQKQVPRFED